MRIKGLITAVTLITAACTTAVTPPPSPAPTSPPPPNPPSISRGFDLTSIDPNVSACRDFYSYANGSWAKKNPIPPAYSRWGNFSILAENNRTKLRTIVEEAASAPGTGDANTQRIGSFYAACMNEAAIEAAGTEPLLPGLQIIGSISSPEQLSDAFAYLQSHGVRAPFAIGATQDPKNTTQVIAQVFQAGLGLPEREYYLRDDARSKEIRDEYVRHVASMFELLGDPPDRAATAARTVMDLETQLAQASMTSVQLRDPNATYNKMTVAQLRTLMPNFAWDAYLRAIGAPSINALNVAQPEFFRKVDAIVMARPLEDWRTYLRWHLVNQSAEWLSKRFVEEDFAFNGRFLEGRKEMLSRDKRCVGATDQALGDALGQLYVARYFPPEAKQRANEMVQNLTVALHDEINSLEWMGADTKRAALVKLEAFDTKIGYPAKWKDYSELQISSTAHIANLSAANRYEFRRDLAKIGQPVDRTEWYMTPPTVNAYNNPLMTEIVFPAGILQSPFYDPEADDAYNYGGIGAVIGHELIHGFDDEGRQYDAQGNVREWWTEEDKKRFEGRAECVANQFAAYEVGPGVTMNGRLVLGESIADLGGLSVAYVAYQRAQAGKPREIVDGFTPEQRFFLGWAQVWATNATPEYERLQATTDPHPIARFRVNGPLSNLSEFATAFGCKATDAMVRTDEKHCDIW